MLRRYGNRCPGDLQHDVVGNQFRMLSLLSDHLDNPDEEGVEGDVDKHDPCGVDAETVEAVVDKAEGKEEGDDYAESLVHVEAGLHDAMVDVGHVGIEHCLAVKFTHDGNADDVDARDEDKCPTDKQGFFPVGKSRFFVRHLVFDGKIGYDISEEQTAGVAHEDFVLADFAKHIINKECQYGSCQSCTNEWEEFETQLME